MATDSILQRRMTARLRSERGVSLIQVAVSIFVLTAFSAFVMDHGVLMVARGQAQNVADAAALSGAITRLRDEPGTADPAVNGWTEKVITQTVDQGTIFGGTSANIGRTWGWTCPTGISGWCVRVNVFRDGTEGSTNLPVYFAPLFGLNSQRTRAMATAVVETANGTSCLKPWIIPDKWDEVTPPADEFNPPLDDYRPYNYTTNTPGSGYSVPADMFTEVTLKAGNPAQAISPSFFFEIEEANVYEESIVGCHITKRIGDTVEVLNGNRVGPTNQGVDALTANGPVDVVVAMFDPEAFEAQRRQSGNFNLTIVNMIGVRVTGRQGNQVTGTIIGGIGEDIGSGGPAPTGGAATLYTIKLVR